jgi:hypothetical protein
MRGSMPVYQYWFQNSLFVSSLLSLVAHEITVP